MYEKFFRFTEAPFNPTPDPQFFFSSPIHEDALSQVLYGITYRKGFIVILGEVGTGKTTLCRHLLETIDPSVRTALILNPGLTTLDLLLSVNEEFGIKCPSTSKKDLVDELHRFLLDTSAVGGNALLMIDEAQNLSVECLEEIRLLSNLETTKQKLLQIVLLGQPELGDMLRRNELRQLAQRIVLRAHLVPFNLEETRCYIASRLRVVGGEDKVVFTAQAVVGGEDKVVFTAQAMERIHVLSGGIPRLINVLCDKALLAGFVAETTEIGEALIEEAAGELRGLNRTGGRIPRMEIFKQSWPGFLNAIHGSFLSKALEFGQRLPGIRRILGASVPTPEAEPTLKARQLPHSNPPR